MIVKLCAHRSYNDTPTTRQVLWNVEYSNSVVFCTYSHSGEREHSDAVGLSAVGRHIGQSGPPLLPLLRLAHDSELRPGGDLDSVRRPRVHVWGSGVQFSLPLSWVSFIDCVCCGRSSTHIWAAIAPLDTYFQCRLKSGCPANTLQRPGQYTPEAMTSL